MNHLLCARNIHRIQEILGSMPLTSIIVRKSDQTCFNEIEISFPSLLSFPTSSLSMFLEHQYMQLPF